MWVPAKVLGIKNRNDNTTKVLVMPHGMLDPWFQTAKGRKINAIRNWIIWKIIERKLENECDGLFFTYEAERLLAKNTFKPYNPH